MAARVVLALILVGAAGVIARAQQTTLDQPQLSASEERIRAALQRHPLISNSQDLVTSDNPRDYRLGALTFVSAETPGQFVALKVPIGDIVTRAAHSVAVAQHRRAARAAHDEVVKAWADFGKPRPQ